MRSSHQWERMAVFGTKAAIATSHPAASLTGFEVLKDGGNAVDAAIAAAAVLCVVEPAMTGIGGDCFVLYARGGSGQAIALNGSGPAPAAASLDWFRERGVREIAPTSPHAVTIPGAIDAWCRLLADHGTRELGTLLRPAIELAENGFVVHRRVAWDWENEADRLRASAPARDEFLPNGHAPKAGDIFRQPSLARTLREIGRKGRAAFYEGAVAAEMTEVLRGLGGLHAMEDFAAYRCEYVTPIETRYRGHRVLECPPNGQGIAVLMLLDVLAGFDLASPALSEADRIHLLAEATKQVYQQRDRLIGDPRQAEVPVAEMLSARRAEELRTRIDPRKAGSPPPWSARPHINTVYFCVVDRDGNAVSFINSIFDSFGSTILAPRSGILLHNRGQSFDLTQGSPNAIAGGKRPFHTIIPGLVMGEDRPVAPFGVMGAHYQAAGHAALLGNLLDRGMDAQQAINHPRSFAFGGALELEPMIADSVAADLAGRGHAIERPGRPLGGAQCIWIDHARGVLIAGSDPRKDGCALAY